MDRRRGGAECASEQASCDPVEHANAAERAGAASRTGESSGEEVGLLPSTASRLHGLVRVLFVLEGFSRRQQIRSNDPQPPPPSPHSPSPSSSCQRPARRSRPSCRLRPRCTQSWSLVRLLRASEEASEQCDGLTRSFPSSPVPAWLLERHVQITPKQSRHDNG